ncbi:MAG TPA: 1,4-dihydroxy-2-naphthoate polyprenyltransferase [Chloroflexota bacterium]|nr:1,4-dihydroxy-2-naphthoate polyprenyltransferase [Chloroflexota bacterium]
MAIPNPSASQPVSGLRGWYLAARPHTLPAAVAPVLVGTALAVAARHFQPLVFLATLICSLLIQIGTNFANDYYDFRKGADTSERLGPTRVTQSGIFTPRQVLLATGYTFSLALVVGAYLVWVGGVPIVVVGILSILCGLGYTGGPYPLGYHGLGDLFVFIFFGLVAVTGTFYLQTGMVSFHTLLASLPVGLLCTNLLVVNNLRDIDTDRAAGKRTLAVRIGRAATRQQYVLFQLISYTVPLTLWQLGASWDYTFWLPLITVPKAVKLALYISRNQDRALNKALKGAADLHMRFGLLFALSLLK